MRRNIRSDSAAVGREDSSRAPGGLLEAHEAEAKNDVQGDESLSGLTSLLRQVLFELNYAVDRNLDGRALTFAKSIPLIALLDGRRHTASSIARDVRYDSGAMTRIIRDLEDKGFITRERSRTDRRVVFLQLTALGREVAGDLPPVLRAVMEVNLACLAGSERQVLIGLLRRVCEGTGLGSSVPVTAPRGDDTKNVKPQW